MKDVFIQEAIKEFKIKFFPKRLVTALNLNGEYLDMPVLAVIYFWSKKLVEAMKLKEKEHIDNMRSIKRQIQHYHDRGRIDDDVWNLLKVIIGNEKKRLKFLQKEKEEKNG